MSDHEHFKKLENMYLAAPNNQYYKPRIVILKAEATISIQIDPNYYHSAGAVHGSIYFKLLDDSTFFAASSLIEKNFLLTTHTSLHLLMPAKNGELTAQAKVIWSGKSYFLTEGRIFNQNSELIAQGTSTLIKSKLHLNNVDNYKI